MLALALLLPLGLATMGVRPLTGPVQVGYAWLMTTGLIGLFRHWLRREVPWVRYLSDASYWIYIAHLPLVVAAQGWVRPWSAPAAVKFLAIVVGSIAVLLASYRILVRPTLLGVLLNGRRG